LALAGGQSVYWSAGAMFILGFTGAIGNIEFGTYLVRNVSDDMIAKVTGIGQMLAIGACALGPLLGGYTVEHWQVQGTIGILLVIVVVLALASLLMPEVSKRIRHGFNSVKQFIARALVPSDAKSATASPASADGSNANTELDRDNGYEVVRRTPRFRSLKETVDHGR
jgi:MFS family permease